MPNINIINKVFKKYDVVFAYLFGSRAGDKYDKESDFDISVMFDKKINSQERFDYRCRLAEEAGKILKAEVDLSVLNDTKSVFFKFVVISEGRPIYENNHQERVEFELKTINDYFDFKPFMDAYNKAYIERAIHS